MARSALTSRSGLEDALATNRHRAQGGRAEVTLAMPGDRALASVIARRNQFDALAARVRDRFRIELAHARRCVADGKIAFNWAGPGQWLAMADGENGAAFERRLRSTLGDLAAVCDQSDSRIIIRLSGSRVREVLAKGVPIDLHPRIFRAGDAAVTTVAHVDAQLWQVDDAPTFELIIARSFAVGFWEWLTESTAELGYLVMDGR